ncbi:hypothetical protein J11TS1_25900 [Oceanobacillus sp. J11TS1]|nr:hypothetical protein J11TS1_25900 [Oceanobacillus sp. J11TS1]
MQERLISVTYFLMIYILSYHAIPELIKLINLLEKEQEGTTYCIGKLDGFPWNTGVKKQFCTYLQMLL